MSMIKRIDTNIREKIIADALNTPEGKLALSQCMVGWNSKDIYNNKYFIKTKIQLHKLKYAKTIKKYEEMLKI